MVKGYEQAEHRRRNKVAVMNNTNEDKKILFFPNQIRKGREIWIRYSRAKAWRSMTQHPVLGEPQGPLDNAHWSDTVTFTPVLWRRDTWDVSWGAGCGWRVRMGSWRLF